MHREEDLREFVERVKEAAEANLVAVVLYGSAADDDFHEKYSDLNVLCLMRSTSGAELAKLRPVGLWWSGKGCPAPLIFTLEELRDSADVFAIELLDIKRQHRMLYGEDFLGGLDVPMSLHRHQVERELRQNVIRLRQAFLRSRGRRADLAELMIASVSSFATLFRHSLIALGETPPHAIATRRAAIERLASTLGVDASPLLTVLDMREGKRDAADLSVEQAFEAYLDTVSAIATEMDRRLAGGAVVKA